MNTSDGSDGPRLEAFLLRQISFHLVSFCILMLSWHIKFSWLVYIIWQSQEGLSVD